MIPEHHGRHRATKIFRPKIFRTKISDQKKIAKKMIKLNNSLDKMNSKITILKEEIKSFKLSTFKKLIENNIRFNDEE